MPEIVSRQVAKLAATATGAGKLSYVDGMGKKRLIVITSPASVTWADGDTIASGIPIPVGSRFTCNAFVSNTAMGTSVICTIGIRNFKTKAVIDADGIGVSINVAAAGRTAVNSGALIASGAEYVTTEEAEVYATLSGATPTANAQIRIEVEVVTPD